MKKEQWPIVALVAGYLIGRLTAAPVQLAFEPVAVKSDETIVADSYRTIQSRRPGMTYVRASVQEGRIEFTPAVDSFFTRNVLSEGGALYAEIKE